MPCRVQKALARLCAAPGRYAPGRQSETRHAIHSLHGPSGPFSPFGFFGFFGFFGGCLRAAA